MRTGSIGVVVSENRNKTILNSFVQGITMAKLQITQSVGLGGVNKPNDIKAVQAALNKLLGLIPPTKKLVEDGKLGLKPENSKTVAAIKAFQKQVVGLVRPDGRIDANGGSHRKINEKLAVTTLTKSTQQLSVKGVTLLQGIEQLRLKPYDDQNGFDITTWVEGATIGYGHLISQVEWPKYQNGTTKAEADILFKADLKPFVDSVKACIKVSITQWEFDALVILAFNIGTNGFKKSSVVKLINDPKVTTSYVNLEGAWKAWNKSQGKVNKGLTNRRNAEWNIFSNNVYKGW